MTAHRFFAFLLAVTLAFAMLSPALAEEAAELEATAAPTAAQDDTLTDAQRLVRGYDADLGYIYINYGRYPYEADGTVAPILWRVLGVDEDGYALLLTEYVIDFAMYHEKKVTIEEWKGNTIYHTLNDEMRKVMFTDEELSAVLRGRDRARLLSALSAAAEGLCTGLDCTALERGYAMRSLPRIAGTLERALCWGHLSAVVPRPVEEA